MKRQIALIIAVLFVVVGCGKDDNNTDNNDNSSSNSTNNSSNNATNNGTNGSNNGTNASNNGTNASNNGTNASNNGTNASNNGTNASNNGTNGTNNPTNNNTNNGGAIRVAAQFTPTSGPVGTEVTIEFTELTNFTLDPDNIGGDDMAGHGHYHVYVDVVDDDHELLVSGTSPDTFNMEIMAEVLADGDHTLIVKVHKNDHTEYSNPIEFSFNDPFTITSM